MIKQEIDGYLTSPDILALALATQKAYGYSMGHLREYCRRRAIHSFEDFQPRMPLYAKWLKQERQITDQSVQQHINNVKIFLAWLGHPVEYTYKISNHDKQAKKRKHSKRWLSENEVAMCLNYPFENSSKINQIKYRLIIRLLVETGCRAKELACLQGYEVDIDEQTLYLSTSKTEPRPAFFSPITQELFLKLKKKKGAWKGELFPSVDRIKQVVNEMLGELGLKNGKDGRGPHVFRHYMSSYLFFIGKMRIEEIAVLMGDTVQIVQSVYLHAPELVLREKISAAWGWD